MHGTLSMTKCARLQGTGSTGRDYAEAVSIMFENFLWTPQHMLDCSLHYSYQSPGYAEAWAKANPGKEQPPRQLPMELIERLVKAQSVGLSLQLLGRVPLSRFDFAVHGPPSREALESMDLSAVYNKIVFDATGLHGLEVETGAWDWGHRFASLRSIATGYDAFVYCYLFSQIWAYDLFETGFKKDTMNAEMGRKYRKLVLYPGGSRPSLDILKDFLGREPNDGAFCRALGIDGLGGEMPQNGNI
jgi:metallopeptidase MepB